MTPKLSPGQIHYLYCTAKETGFSSSGVKFMTLDTLISADLIYEVKWRVRLWKPKYRATRKGMLWLRELEDERKNQSRQVTPAAL